MMRALSRFAPGTMGTPGAALCGKASGCPRTWIDAGDAGDKARSTLADLSPLSPLAGMMWGHGKPLTHKAVPAVPTVPAENIGGRHAF
ncbi:protein of unknown function [Burkholderia multivorans]